MALLAEWVSASSAVALGGVSVRFTSPLSSPSLSMACGPRKKKRRELKKPDYGNGDETTEGTPSHWKDSVSKEQKKVRRPAGVGNSIGFGKLGEESMTWRCGSGCGACCKLRKGPEFPSYAEIFSDSDPQLAEMVESMIGDDGWCTHYDHNTRTCSIYAERPFFCRVDPEVFLKLYAIDHKSFNSEACRACRDTIKTVYGLRSQELKNFNATISNGNLMHAGPSPA